MATERVLNSLRFGRISARNYQFRIYNSARESFHESFTPKPPNVLVKLPISVTYLNLQFIVIWSLRSKLVKLLIDI